MPTLSLTEAHLTHAFAIVSTLGQYTSQPKSLSSLEARLGSKSGEQFVKKLNEICAELKNDKQTNNVGVGGVVEGG